MSNKAGHSDYQKYKKYYLGREASPAGVKKRVERDQARTKMIKAGKIAKHSKQEVDHKQALDKGGGNAMANLQVLSRRANRHKYD